MVDPKVSFGTFPVCDGDQAPGEMAHVEMPLVARLRTSVTKMIRILLAELERLATDGLIAERDATSGHQVFHIAKTERELEIQPNRVSDNLSWVAMTLVRRCRLSVFMP